MSITNPHKLKPGDLLFIDQSSDLHKCVLVGETWIGIDEGEVIMYLGPAVLDAKWKVCDILFRDKKAKVLTWYLVGYCVMLEDSNI